MSKHTPGPWKVQPLGGHKYYGTIVLLPDGAQIKVWGSRSGVPSSREVREWDGADPDWDIGDITSDGHYEDDEDYANARLIAAAPDLLKALKAIIASQQQWVEMPKPLLGPSVRELEAARVAIAKAEGDEDGHTNEG